MASAFGGQRSIQLSYGCLLRGIARRATPRNLYFTLCKQFVRQLERINQDINFFNCIVHAK